MGRTINHIDVILKYREFFEGLKFKYDMKILCLRYVEQEFMIHNFEDWGFTLEWEHRNFSRHISWDEYDSILLQR